MTEETFSPKAGRAQYRALQDRRPDYFRDPIDSPVAILTTDNDIMAAQSEEAARRDVQGLSFPDLRIGVLASDPYLGLLTRDAVRFADGSLGVYNRHIGEPGCVILPILAGSVVLIRIFRHATRDWAWEFPGGRVSPGEDATEAARHELEEEIGAHAPVLQSLGTIQPYPAFSSASIHLFVATIDRVGAPQVAEGIASVETVSAAHLFEMVNDGIIQDGAALACILKARLKGLI